MKKIIITCLTLFVFITTMNAQNNDSLSVKEEVLPLKNFISFVPQYLLIDGTRLDFEHRHNIKHGFVFSGTVYTGTIGDFLFDNEGHDLFGGSVELLHKIYLGREMPKAYENSNQLYLAHGPIYHRSAITYQGVSWENTQVDGLNVLESVEKEQKTIIDKIGYSVLLGVQVITENRFTFDLYTGVGFRHSFISKTSNTGGDYDDFWVSPGYSGNLLLLGCKLGVAF